MTWLLAAYFLLALGVALAALLDREDSNLSADLVEFFGTCIVLVCAAAYWLPRLHAALGSSLPWLAAAGGAGLVVGTVQDSRRHLRGKNPAVVATVLALLLAAYGPATFWAFAAAAGRTHNGA